MNGSRAKKLRKQIYGEDGSPMQRDQVTGIRKWFGKSKESKNKDMMHRTTLGSANAGKPRRSYQIAKKQAKTGGQ